MISNLIYLSCIYNFKHLTDFAVKKQKQTASLYQGPGNVKKKKEKSDGESGVMVKNQSVMLQQTK